MKNAYSALQVGQSLGEIKKPMTQEMINAYARASHDYNPVHIDAEFARKTPAGGTIAHGMLNLAFCSQLMTRAFGKNWLNGGRFNVRFKMPARPGDDLTVQGRIEKISQENQQMRVTCSVLCINQKGETIISGEAVVRLSE
ncbi:MAG TPA: MaoC family dehydratase [Dehalococcoidales bacterium]|nr:MaoC family dehydratase [Dehalococcoidales bacterium]